MGEKNGNVNKQKDKNDGYNRYRSFDDFCFCGNDKCPVQAQLAEEQPVS